MEPQLDPRSRKLFERALSALSDANVPFVIGGAFALNHYTGVWRDTKDLDLFCERRFAEDALSVLEKAGFRTFVEEKHWLGKAVANGAMVDLIWGGGNWATFVDEQWLARAPSATLLGHGVMFAAAEDIIISKAYVAGRERFDGTDIAHLIHACGRSFDWDDLVTRFGDHWPLLLHYLVLFRFVYVEERNIAPTEILHRLAKRIGTDDEIRDGLTFHKPLLDPYGYLSDLAAHGRPDPRETLARRAGLPVADVALRRQLDSEALSEGLPYRKEWEQARRR